MHPLRALWMPLATAAFLGYFGYHAFNGAFGIWSMEEMKAEGVELSAQLADLTAQRTALESRVARMRPDSLDADLADTMARGQLNVLRGDEVIVDPAAMR